MSILALRGHKKRGIKYLAFSVTALTLAVFLATMVFANLVMASSALDVVSAVASRHFSNSDYGSNREDVTGHDFPMVQGWGDYGAGEAGISLLGPVKPNEIQVLLDYVDNMTQYTNLQTTPLKGCEVREYTMQHGAGAGVILPDYFLTIEIYASGNSAAADITTGKKILQEVLDGLEKAGLLSQTAPDIIEEKPEKVDKKEGVPVSVGQSAIPLDEPTTVSDTMNIDWVDNGPTAPTLFVIDRPHLVTEIVNYHWNHGNGASLGTISLVDQNGRTYGPWSAKGSDGQGGVTNANWHVYPNIVVPAGTYTIIDSDPATWAQNAASGGRGMGFVNATPNFEAAGGKLPDFCDCEGPAGVGRVGNIPGPANTTEAVTGVVVPGAIATALGALAGLGGSGGFTPPPAGGTPIYPTGGSSYPGPVRGSEAGRGATGMAVGGTNQIGRRRSGEDFIPHDGQIYIDTEAEMREVLVQPPGEIYIEPAAEMQEIFINPNKIYIDPKEEAGVFTDPNRGIHIDTEDMQQVIIQPQDAIYIDTNAIGADIVVDEMNPKSFVIAPERTETEEFILFSKPSEEVTVDTSAFDGAEVKAGEFSDTDAVSPYDQEGFDANGFDKDGFDKAGFDSEGFNRDGFDKTGFDREGFDKNGFDLKGFDKDGFDKAGFDSEGFNRDGFDKTGFDREGFDKNGFDLKGFDKDGFDKAGFDKAGYDRDGFNKNGFDREGYGKNGLDSEGFDRDGYNIDGFDRKGYNRQGFDAKGYDKNGFDKNGLDKNGWDQDGYDKNGFNAKGFDRDGYDKNGYDTEGYNRQGLDKNGQSREGYDADGYDKNGFNQNGFDKDGFDREGFNYEGYNRSGYDPWGYNRQGYAKNGYHWSGYNADGYDRSGRHWSENPYGEGSPFNVDTRNPFDGGIVDLGGRREAWQPTKPALGEPYPRTLEKYGLKKWGDTIPNEPEIEIPPQVPESSGVIGPEDPMNTIKNHGRGEDGLPLAKEKPSLEYGSPDDMPQADMPAGDISSGGGFPLDGEKRILVGGTDGQTYEIEYDGKTGEWVNTETGNAFNPEQFERWQNDLAEDKRRAAEDIAKMAAREDATSKAIDENLADWKKLDQMQKTAEKYGVGESGGSGDMDKAIQNLKDDMLAGRELDKDRVEQLKKIINNRIEGKTASKYSASKEETWIDTLGYGLEANMATAKEVITGEKSDGSISYLGIGARIMMTAATGGAAGTVIDGTFTAAEALYRMKDSVDKDESTFRTVSKAIGMVILGEQVSRGLSFGGNALNKEFLERFPVATNKAADWLETTLLKGSALNQRLSYKLGMIGKESAENSLDQINKRLVDIGQDKVADGIVDTATKGYGLAVANTFEDVSKKVADSATDNIGRGVGRAATGSADDVAGVATRRAAAGSADDAAGVATRRAAAGSTDDAADAARKAAAGSTDATPPRQAPRSADEIMADPAAVNRAQNQVRDSVDNFDKMPAAKQQELVREQAVYDEYKLQAQNRTSDIADKVRRNEPLTVDEIMEMKADPASMRTLKNAHEDGIGHQLSRQEAEAAQTSFNEALDRQIHQPSYEKVQEHLHGKFKDAKPGEIRCRTVRTPGAEPSISNINTDNDVIAERLVNGPNGPEWVEIPKSDWDDVYYKAFAENSGFSVEKASQKFPDTNWANLDDAAKYKTWASRHEEAAMDQFDLSAGRDFSNQRTWRLRDGDLPGRPMIEATPEEIARGVETVTIDGKQMRPSSGYELTQRGQGTLLDSEQLGLMEGHKIDQYWNSGTTPSEVMRNQTEALEQLRKTADLAQTVEKSYQGMGYKVADMPSNMEEAIKVIKNNNLSPAARVARLQELGYDSPGNFMEKVTSRIGAIRSATKK